MTELATRAGLSLAVPPATVADAAALTACFDRVSGEDRRFRFFSASQHVSHEQLDPLIHADHFTSKSWLAFDKAGNELVASGLLACGKALDTGEIAVSVRGDYKGMGVGWALLDHIAREAEAGGAGSSRSKAATTTPRSQWNATRASSPNRSRTIRRWSSWPRPCADPEQAGMSEAYTEAWRESIAAPETFWSWAAQAVEWYSHMEPSQSPTG